MFSNSLEDLSLVDSTIQSKNREYRIESRIGKGSFSVIYRVYDLKDKERKALKMLKKTGLSDSDVSSFIKEVNILKEVENHPNIVRYFDDFKFNGHYCILMELCVENDLREYIKRNGHFSQNKLISWARQLSSALKYIHEFNIIHRDIKPENILIKEEKPLLADFGLAKQLVHSVSLANTQCGTACYAAPELFDSDLNPYNKKIDVWSLGCVIYEMITCQKAFYSVEDILYGKIPVVDTDYILDSLIKLMLERDPTKRKDAKEIHGAIRKIQAML